MLEHRNCEGWYPNKVKETLSAYLLLSRKIKTFHKEAQCFRVCSKFEWVYHESLNVGVGKECMSLVQHAGKNTMGKFTWGVLSPTWRF